MRFKMRKACTGALHLVLLEDGQDLVEYSLILLVVTTGGVAAVGAMGTQLINLYTYIVAHLP
jgi:Flp pilus assembly pilin Flp